MDPEKSNDIREQVASLAARLFRDSDEEFDSTDHALYVVLCAAAREYLSDYPGTEDGRWTGNDLWATLQSMYENLAPEAVDYDPKAPLRMVSYEAALVDMRRDNPDNIVSVYAIYKMARVHGEYNVATHEFRLTKGPLNRERLRTYRSPSGATTAVIEQLNPGVKPVRNWKTFWKVHADGRDLWQYLVQSGKADPRKVRKRRATVK